MFQQSLARMGNILQLNCGIIAASASNPKTLFTRVLKLTLAGYHTSGNPYCPDSSAVLGRSSKHWLGYI